jgi:hypothetical protein
MKQVEHEKKRLPRAVELEKRRFVGFNREPVVETEKVFINAPSEAINRYDVAVYPAWGDR